MAAGGLEAQERRVDGRSSRWDAHREERRAELVLASVRAIDRHGPSASVAQIAAEAKVSKPVLYRYFADKHELHAAVGRWGAQSVIDLLLPAVLADAPLRVRIERGVEAYLSAIEAHPRVFLLLVRHRDDAGEGVDPLADGKARIVALLAGLLRDALRDLGLDTTGAEPWAHALVGIGLSTGEWWVAQATMSKDDLARYLVDILWHAVSGVVGSAG